MTSPDLTPNVVIVTTDNVARMIVRREHNVKVGAAYDFTPADYERLAIVRHTLDDIARHLGFDADNLIGAQAVELLDLFHETDERI